MGELSPEEERRVFEAMVSHQAGIDPDRLGSVVDLAAVGMVLHVWRNSPVEDWHAGSSPLHDGDMLRINSHTTWKVRQILRRWVADTRLDGDGPTDQLEMVEPELVDELFPRLYEWMVNPARRLPTGQTLAELAVANDGELAEFEDHAERELGAYCAVIERDGAVACFWRAAAAGGVGCRHWWGTPPWPQLVDRFLHVLEQPDHEHWGRGGEYRSRLGLNRRRSRTAPFWTAPCGNARGNSTHQQQTGSSGPVSAFCANPYLHYPTTSSNGTL